MRERERSEGMQERKKFKEISMVFIKFLGKWVMAKENVDWMTENYNERNFNETK